MIMTEIKLNKVPLKLTMDVTSIAKTINRLKPPNPTPFDLSEEAVEYHVSLAEELFYSLQKDETIRHNIIEKMPKKKDHTFEINRVYVIEVFDALLYESAEYGTISKYQFYAKAISDHEGVLEFGLRKE